jgi:hypothetical protein
MTYSAPVILLAILAVAGALCGRFYSVLVLVPANLVLALLVVSVSVASGAGPLAMMIWFVKGSLTLQLSLLAALAAPRTNRRTFGAVDQIDKVFRTNLAPGRQRSFDEAQSRQRAFWVGRLDVSD